MGEFWVISAKVRNFNETRLLSSEKFGANWKIRLENWGPGKIWNFCLGGFYRENWEILTNVFREGAVLIYMGRRLMKSGGMFCVREKIYGRIERGLKIQSWKSPRELLLKNGIQI